MRILTACCVVLAVAGCSAEPTSAPPAPRQTPSPTGASTTPKPPASTAPVVLTRTTFTPTVEKALDAKPAFRVRTTVRDKKNTPITAEINGGRIRMTVGGLTMIGIEHDQYAASPKLTGNKNKPWILLDRYSDNPGMRFLAELLKLAADQVMAHELIYVAPYTTSFTAGKQENVGGVSTIAYHLVVDMNQAKDAQAFDDYFDADDLAALPRKFPITIWVSRDNLPRKTSYTIKGKRVVALFDKFGQVPPVAVPPPAKTGTLNG